jgi:hypothetical protein
VSDGQWSVILLLVGIGGIIIAATMDNIFVAIAGLCSVITSVGYQITDALKRD